MIAQLGKESLNRYGSAPQDLDEFLEFQAHLMNQLLALVQINLCIVAGEPIARTADRETLFVQQTADLPDNQHVLTLIVAAIAATFHRLQLREFLLPVAQDVRLDAAQIADLANGEVALPRDRR